MKYRVDKIDALLVIMLVAMDRNFIRCNLTDETANKELAVVNYNFSYPHPQVVFTDWAKESGWTKAFNKDWYIHDAVKEVLVAEGIVPGKVTPKKQQTKPQQTTSQAPKPQQQVSEIVRQKVKVSQAPKPQAKQEQNEIKLQKPQKADGIKMMSDEELAAEIHKISDFENDFVDPDLL